MRKLSLIGSGMCLFLFLFMILIITEAKNPDCNYEESKDDICLIKIKDLYPTQFAVGNQEVLCKANLFSQMTENELEEYLDEEKQLVYAVISQNKYYVLDGHHMIRALWVGIDDNVEVNLKIYENWNEYTMEEFDKAMVDQDLFYLNNSGTGPISPILLPTFENIDDDMFRTLSWLVRKAGGYDKGTVVYAEFIWADWLRRQIDLPPPAVQSEYCDIVPYSSLCIPDQKKLLESLIAPGLVLALSQEASNLPGWHEGTIDAPNCGKSFSWDYAPWNETTATEATATATLSTTNSTELDPTEIDSDPLILINETSQSSEMPTTGSNPDQHRSHNTMVIIISSCIMSAIVLVTVVIVLYCNKNSGQKYSLIPRGH